MIFSQGMIKIYHMKKVFNFFKVILIVIKEEDYKNKSFPDEKNIDPQKLKFY